MKFLFVDKRKYIKNNHNKVVHNKVEVIMVKSDRRTLLNPRVHFGLTPT